MFDPYEDEDKSSAYASIRSLIRAMQGLDPDEEETPDKNAQTPSGEVATQMADLVTDLRGELEARGITPCSPELLAAVLRFWTMVGGGRG